MVPRSITVTRRASSRRLVGRGAGLPAIAIFCAIFLLSRLGESAAASPTHANAEDQLYNIAEDDVAWMRNLDAPLLNTVLAVVDNDEAAWEGAGGADDGDVGEPELTEADKVSMNRSHTALLKVVALSWPSEGVFGAKVAKNFPPDQPSSYSWQRAERKAFQILYHSERQSRASGPSEEVLMALGYRYLHGIGTRRDCQQALECYNSVAESVSRYMEENDSRETKLDLGLMRISLSEMDGILGEDLEDTGEALEFDRLSAQGGDMWAQKEVGWRSLVGRGIEEDHGQALQNLQAAADIGDPDAQHNIGYMYMNALGVERNLSKAKSYFDAAAKYNVTAALNALGYMHYRGAGVPRNLTLGEHYLLLAANKDDADAAFNLAALYQEVDGNLSRAMAFVEQAADSGFWRALLALADIHDMGLGRPRNCTAAVVALKKMVETHGGVANELRAAVEAYQGGHERAAHQMMCELAEQGIEVAQSNCAWLYFKGRHAAPAANETLRMVAVGKMFARGGQQGGGDAHLRLGDMAWYGYAGPANLSAAAEHYKIAVARRSQQAAFALGYMHQFGKGVERNLTLAKRYYKRSGNLHHFTRYPAALALSLLAAQACVEHLLHLVVGVEWGGRALVTKATREWLQPSDEAELAARSCIILSLLLASTMLVLTSCFLLVSRLEAQHHRRATEDGGAGQRRVPDIAAWLHADDVFAREAY